MPYAKGVTGNGQIRSKPVRDALCAILTRDSDDPLNDARKAIAQTIAMELVRDAMSTNEKIRLPARSELIDRTDGKAIQALEHSGHIFRTHEEELAWVPLTSTDSPNRVDALV
jgi:hypothetical protein